MAKQHRDPEDFDEDDVPPAAINRETLREAVRLAGYLWPYRWLFTFALVSLLLTSLLGLAFPYVTGSLVDLAITKGNVSDLPWHQTIDGIALLLIGVLVVDAIFSFVHSYGFTMVSERSLADLRQDTYARIVRLPMAFHTRRRVGELASRLTADLTQIQDTLVYAFPQFLRQSATLVGGVTLIALSSGKLTLIMLASFPVLIVVAVVFGRFIRKTSKDAQDRLAESNVVVEETLQGIADVKAFTNERREEARYRNRLDAFLVAVLKGAVYRGLFVSFIIFALFGSLVLVLWFGVHMVQDGELSVGELTRFMLYTLYVGGAMGSFAELFSQIQRTLGATQRVRELLHESREEEPERQPDSTRRFAGEVHFQNVHFRYPSREDIEVLRGVSLEAKPGQRIALVGPSGAGKSTLLSLLLRFYEPTSGRILIDGRDARDYPLLELRGQTALVPQDVLLFGGTIAENIAYGDPDADEPALIEAAKQANAHEFITGFPEGYETRVGERGVQLSGGQRQRIAIARAILRNPTILILDEATSSLDSENESLILQALDRLMEGRTSFVIAHRLSTVRRADRIYVLKEGNIVESGTHEELLAETDGVYRNLSELQIQ